jgi:hypothetical protein
MASGNDIKKKPARLRIALLRAALRYSFPLQNPG